jgi:hypothetical protein
MLGMNGGLALFMSLTLVSFSKKYEKKKIFLV